MNADVRIEEGGSEAGRRPPRHIVMLTVGAAVMSTIAFMALLWLLPHSGSAAGDQGLEPTGRMLVFTSVVMLVAGALGGCLYNFRGLVKHSQENDFDTRYNLSYQLRPLQGALSGLMVFFLLLGGTITLTLGGGRDADSWLTLPGLLPYIAFGILAGYASHEFMSKLKDLAGTLFTMRRGG